MIQEHFNKVYQISASACVTEIRPCQGHYYLLPNMCFDFIVNTHFRQMQRSLSILKVQQDNVESNLWFPNKLVKFISSTKSTVKRFYYICLNSNNVKKFYKRYPLKSGVFGLWRPSNKHLVSFNLEMQLKFSYIIIDFSDDRISNDQDKVLDWLGLNNESSQRAILDVCSS